MEKVTDNKVKNLLIHNLKTYRQRNKLSIEAMAEKIGISVNFYKGIEKGEKFLSANTFLKIWENLKLPPHKLLLPPFGIDDYDKVDLAMRIIDEFSDEFENCKNKIRAKYKKA